MSRKALRFVGPALVIIAGLLVWHLLRNRTQAPPDQLFGNGTIEATEVDVSAKVAGKVTALKVEEGDAVRVGEVIAILDSGELEGQVQQAEGALRAAEAALAELMAGTRPEEIHRAEAQYAAVQRALARAQARRDLVRAGPRQEEIAQLRAALGQAEVMLVDAETELMRVETLERQGAIPGQQVDQARTRRDVARAQVEAARQRLVEAQSGARPQEIREAEAAVAQAESEVRAARAALDLARAGPRAETIAAAGGRVEQARGALRSAQAQHGYAEVASPVNGTVALRNVELGELATPGLPIVRVDVLDRLWLRVYLPEPELGRVKLGQRAEVSSDTYPGRPYPGRVIEIAQQAEFTPKNVQTREERVKLVFAVKIEVENRNQELKPGMPADAVIFVGPPRANARSSR